MKLTFDNWKGQAFITQCKEVLRWAGDKGIFNNSTALLQNGKMVEEVYELKHAITMKDRDAVEDELGDVLVTAIVQAQFWGLDPVHCLTRAVEKITARDGEMKDGLYVKTKSTEEQIA
tara:strand:+ start:521 stop:874 length:354 start_codon:yes stop_codon:yes gene_type:complete